VLSIFEEPVRTACSDGSKVTISPLAEFALRKEGNTNVTVVHSNGAKYYYANARALDRTRVYFLARHDGKQQRVPLADFVAYRTGLHRRLKGEGEIRHDGSDSFLDHNFSRDAWPDTSSFVVKVPKGKSLTVDTDLKRSQLAWLSQRDLFVKASKCAAKKTNPQIGAEVVADVFAEMVERISVGKMPVETKEAFEKYVMRAVRNVCNDAASDGFINGDILPDKLRVKGITVPMLEDNDFSQCPE